MATQIRQALVSSFGDVGCINVVDASLPDPSGSNVQVRIIYAGFGGSDVNMRTGNYPMQKKAPLVPGYCMVGRVAKNGPGCNQFAIGTLVAALTVYDSDATAINIPEKYLIAVPEGTNLKQAVCLVLDWSTAYGMVARAAKVSKGQKVFVHGMSGAVGYAAMVLCQLRGAIVYGTASERNHAKLKEMGAHPFVYTNKDPFVYTNKEWMSEMTRLGGADAVFDPLGFESWDESYAILSSTGILVGYGGLGRILGNTTGSTIWPTLKLMGRGMLPGGKRTSFYYISRDQKTFVPELKELFELLQQGKINAPIKQVFDLEDIKEAHSNWGKNPGMGSIVVKVAEEEL